MARAGATATVTTSGALVEALRSLGIWRLAVGTPYTTELGARLPPFLAEFGYEVVNLVNMGLEEGIASVGDEQVIANPGERIVEGVAVSGGATQTASAADEAKPEPTKVSSARN